METRQFRTEATVILRLSAGVQSWVLGVRNSQVPTGLMEQKLNQPGKYRAVGSGLASGGWGCGRAKQKKYHLYSGLTLRLWD